MTRRELLMALACGMLTIGCTRPPAVQYHNLKLISSLRTAISAQNSAWLEGVAKAVTVRRDAGEMDSEEYEHFQAIIAVARAGRWKDAEQDCFRFETAQLNRRRPPPKDTDEHQH